MRYQPAPARTPATGTWRKNSSALPRLTFCEDIPHDCVTERLVVYYLPFAEHVQLSPCMVEIMRYAG